MPRGKLQNAAHILLVSSAPLWTMPWILTQGLYTAPLWTMPWILTQGLYNPWSPYQSIAPSRLDIRTRPLLHIPHTFTHTPCKLMTSPSNLHRLINMQIKSEEGDLGGASITVRCMSGACWRWPGNSSAVWGCLDPTKSSSSDHQAFHHRS